MTDLMTLCVIISDLKIIFFHFYFSQRTIRMIETFLGGPFCIPLRFSVIFNPNFCYDNDCILRDVQCTKSLHQNYKTTRTPAWSSVPPSLRCGSDREGAVEPRCNKLR